MVASKLESFLRCEFVEEASVADVELSWGVVSHAM